MTLAKADVMDVAKPWKLRTYLYLLTLGVVLPGIALVCWNAYSQFSSAETEAHREAYGIAEMTADNTASFLQDARQLLETLVHRVELRGVDQNGCDPIFREISGLFPRFANLSQSNRNGYMICSTVSQPGDKQTRVNETEWFKMVYEQKQFIVAPPYKGIVTGRMVSVLAYPLRNNEGEVTGALQLPIDLANFKLIPAKSALPRSTTISIVDSRGVLVARSQAPEQFVGKNLHGVKALQDMFRIKDGSIKSVSSEGVERIYGFRPVPGTDWTISVGIDTSETLKNSRDAAITNAILGLAGVLFAATIAFLMSRKIAAPIIKMQETATRVARGEYDRRAYVGGPKEIADVANQFNVMLNAIESSRAIQLEREAHINLLASFDPLTGLPNRRVLIETIDTQLRLSRENSQVGAVLYIDLDHFKDINDAYGHQAGDTFLKNVATRISGLLKENDSLARIGGDEFVYVVGSLNCPPADGASAAFDLGVKIQAALKTNAKPNSDWRGTSASIGITIFPKSGDTSETLLHEADIAMYYVKKAGRSHVALFETSMREQVTDRIGIEADLRNAVVENQLEIYLQTQVDSAGHVTGAEVLLRWNHPIRGMVSPAIFIPQAEQSHLIVQIGDWVLVEGCKAMVASQSIGENLSISINVSPRQFRHPGFVAKVFDAISETGADPSLLIFEVTEGLLIDDVETTIVRMNELAAAGIRFSIDDFGTGYSSLAYLKRLPLYELKIDKSFIRDTPVDPNDTAIVQSIIGIAKNLSLHVVAEGVETYAQAEFLAASGCNSMQGYFFARPIPLKQWLNSTVVSKPIDV